MALWRRLETVVALWRRLETVAALWRRLETVVALWRRSEADVARGAVPPLLDEANDTAPPRQPCHRRQRCRFTY